jgi:hypothetical protein
MSSEPLPPDADADAVIDRMIDRLFRPAPKVFEDGPYKGKTLEQVLAERDQFRHEMGE